MRTSNDSGFGVPDWPCSSIVTCAQYCFWESTGAFTGEVSPHFIADATSFYLDFHRKYFGYAGCSINDPCAVALAFQPDLAETVDVFIDVEIDSPKTIGKTFADVQNTLQRAPNVRLVRNFNNEAFLALFVERMADLARRHPEPAL